MATTSTLPSHVVYPEDSSQFSTDGATLDQAVTEALRQPFNIDVPEERERLVHAVHERVPASRLDVVRSAVRRTLKGRRKKRDDDDDETEPENEQLLSHQGRHGVSPVELEGGELADAMRLQQVSDFEMAVNAEVDRVLDDVTAKLKLMLRSGTYLDQSSPETNEFFGCVQTQYHPAAAKAVEEEVRMTFQRAYAEQRPIRPFYRSHIRYNFNAPFLREPKQIVLTAFFFQWLQDPRSLPPSQTPVASASAAPNQTQAGTSTTVVVLPP